MLLAVEALACNLQMLREIFTSLSSGESGISTCCREEKETNFRREMHVLSLFCSRSFLPVTFLDEEEGKSAHLFTSALAFNLRLARSTRVAQPIPKFYHACHFHLASCIVSVSQSHQTVLRSVITRTMLPLPAISTSFSCQLSSTLIACPPPSPPPRG